MSEPVKHQTASCTILIPTKDRPNFLKRATMSAIEAAPDDGEILIIDDKSTVPATHVLKNVTDGRLRIIRIENNIGGAAGTRNAGITFFNGYSHFPVG